MNQIAFFQTHTVDKSCLSLWEEVSGDRRAKKARVGPSGQNNEQTESRLLSYGTGNKYLMSKKTVLIFRPSNWTFKNISKEYNQWYKELYTLVSSF